MTRDELTKKVSQIASAVVMDRRWNNQALEVSILGMLLYGYALAVGRIVMLLELEDIEAAVLQTMIRTVGSAEKWSAGLVADASKSAFDKAHHPGQHELIGVGHSYFGAKDQAVIVENIFVNFARFRDQAR
ncbi:hypothetical protein EI77_00891 [Prosthecobacter fusiformis]|uniref:Uncharacterized protein n=1 Tax=Prosthecobacter fusiformis TaxID=48464 RepID=A0A4R7SR59_9BACT|nr:hypothetical protein [Prosthecobacter fusiformis]TDU81581.1 hypothetical protein EI77_00891 [Prosthecobacter fusiformis]